MKRRRPMSPLQSRDDAGTMNDESFSWRSKHDEEEELASPSPVDSLVLMGGKHSSLSSPLLSPIRQRIANVFDSDTMAPSSSSLFLDVLDTSDELSPAQTSPPSSSNELLASISEATHSWTGLHRRQRSVPLPSPERIHQHTFSPLRHQRRDAPWSPYRNHRPPLARRTVWNLLKQQKWRLVAIGISIWFVVVTCLFCFFPIPTDDQRNQSAAISPFLSFASSSSRAGKNNADEWSLRQISKQATKYKADMADALQKRNELRRERTRPSGDCLRSFEGPSSKVFQPPAPTATNQYVLPRTRHLTALASVESLCGIYAQQGSLQNASYFPMQYALTSASRVVLIGGGRLALEFASILQQRCGAQIDMLVLQQTIEDRFESNVFRDFELLVLHQQGGGPHVVDRTDWSPDSYHSKYHHHHEDSGSPPAISSTTHSTHVVYFAPDHVNLTLSHITRTTLALQKLLKLQRDDQHVLYVDFATSPSVVEPWMRHFFARLNRPNLIGIQLPLFMAYSTSPSPGNEQDKAKKRHVLDAMVAAMQLDVDEPGLDISLYDDSFNVAHRYLGGWTPTSMCEWCEDTHELLPSCASECVAQPASSSCEPSVWHTDIVREITQGCQTVLYTTVPTAHSNHPLSHAQYDANNSICNVAFVHRHSPLVHLALEKVPNEQLVRFGVHATAEQSIHEQKVAKLNGRLLYRGWILVWPVATPGDSSHNSMRSEWAVIKLAPKHFLSDSVRHAVYVQSTLSVNITLAQVQGLLSKMSAEPKEACIVKIGPKRFLLPMEPLRRAVMLVSQLERPKKLHGHSEPYQMTAKEAARVLLGGNVEKEPRAVKRHRDTYSRLGKWLNGGRLHAAYRYELESHFVDTSVLIHDVRTLEAHELRCEWYMHHLPFESASLDALSLAHVLALRDLRRRQDFEEPEDHELHHFKRLVLKDKQQFTDDWEWMPLETTSNRAWVASRYDFPTAPWDQARQQQALAREQERVDAMGQNEEPKLYVRIVAEG